MIFSHSTRTFYDPSDEDIPADGINVSEEAYQTFVRETSLGNHVSMSMDGTPTVTVFHTNNLFLTIEQALQYLNSTDWYYIRQLDTGQSIPQDVVDNRAAARAMLNESV